MHTRRWMTMLCTAAAICMGAEATVYAGSLGDFTDSVRDQQTDDDDSGGHDDDDDDSGWHTDDDWDDSGNGGWNTGSSSSGSHSELGEGCGLAVMYAFVGYTPGHQFDVGTNPYDPVRGLITDEDIVNGAVQYASYEEDVSAERIRDVEIMVSAANAVTTQFDAMGLHLRARIGSTRTPSLSVDYQGMFENIGTGEGLRVAFVALQPTIYWNKWFHLSYSLGYSFFGDERGSIGQGGGAALNASIYPIKPLSVRMRTGAHVLGPSGVLIFDSFLGAGVQATEHIFFEAGVRRLNIAEGAALTTPELGITMMWGL